MSLLSPVMRYRIECEDRNTGEAYVIEQEARSPEAALRLAMLAGHAALRPAEDRPAPLHAARPVVAKPPVGTAADGRSVAGLVVSCLALALCCVPVALPLAVVGIALGASGARPGGIRSAAIAVGVVAAVLAGFSLAAWIVVWPA